MNCPKCHGATHVFETRQSSNGKRRRRECAECKHRFSTLEVLADEVQRYDRTMRKLQNTVAMVEFMRDNCTIALSHLDKLEAEID
jgi:transcriptional regulator NrdR family protein